MQKFALAAFSLAYLLGACAPAAQEAVKLAEPSATPFPMENGLFTGAPQDFLLDETELSGLYTAADAGVESPNSAVMEGRPDGEAYLAATGRIGGWRTQFNRNEDAIDGPTYVVNVVNIYESAEGAQLVLSQDWHQDVWSLIYNGQLTQMPEIEGLDAQHLIWRDANGTVGVEIVYRNLYILLTGPSEGGDQYQFFADLAKTHLDWIKAGES